MTFHGEIIIKLNSGEILMTNGGLTRSAPDEITEDQNISIVTHFLTQSPPYHQKEGEI